MTEWRKLTQEQRTLFWQLDNAISDEKGVADILQNKDSKDIEAVLTVFSPTGLALLSSVVYWQNLETLKDILNATSKIPCLNKKILTEGRFKGRDGKNYTLLGCAKLYARAYCKNQVEEEAAKEIVEMIQNMNPVPEEQQNQDARPDPVTDSSKSPSFLSQNKGKFAIIGAVALVGTIAAFMSGYPIIGIIVALAATFMLATDKGRRMCDKVGERLYDALPECFKSKEAAKG